MDTSIALSYKPVQLDIEGAMQFRENKKRLESQNALAAAQMANQQDELNNALNARQYAGSSDLSDPKNAMGLLRFGKQGADMYQGLLAGQASSASARKSQIEAAGSKTAHYRQILPLVNNPQDAMKWLEMIHGDPDMQDSPVARMPLDVAMSRIPQDPAGFQQWKQQAALGIDKYIERTTLTANERSMETDRAATRTETGRHNLAMEQRSKVDPMQYPLLAAAVAENRMSPDRVNSRNAGFLEQALQRNPTADLNAMAARGALMRNAGFQQKAISAEIIPEVLQNVVNAGKKLDFSDVKFIANIQKWTAGQLQDPKLTEYMTLRNDSLLSIAATMRLVGMSDYATKLEEEAAAPTMSPKQLDAWMSGQMKALNPRLKKLAGLSIDGANPAAPSDTPAANTPAGAVVQVITDADYNKLPSGTLFVDPNGEQRRKP